MGGGYGCIGKEFSEVLESHQADGVRLDLVLIIDLHSLEIRIASTILDRVPKLFAALASDAFELARFLLLSAFVVIFFLVVSAALMLGKLTARLIFATLSTAPPELTSKLRPVQPTTPVEVVLLVELFATVLADFEPVVDFALAKFQLDDSLAHLFPFGDQGFDLLFEARFLFD